MDYRPSRRGLRVLTSKAAVYPLPLLVNEKISHIQGPRFLWIETLCPAFLLVLYYYHPDLLPELLRFLSEILIQTSIQTINTLPMQLILELPRIRSLIW